MTSTLALSYLKTSWRKMTRQKGYAFINVAGLAVGLACALFILLWVQDELSYDRFHANAPALFRVEQDQSGGQGTFHVNVSPYPMGPAIQAAIPAIKTSIRLSFTGGLLVRAGDKAFFENRVIAERYGGSITTAMAVAIDRMHQETWEPSPPGTPWQQVRCWWHCWCWD